MVNQTSKMVLSKMVCADDLPLARVANFETIRDSIEAKTKQKLPNSQATLRLMIMEFYGEAESFIKQKMKSIETMKSMTIDEWTRCSNKKYLNVNVHASNESYCLGLVNITEKATSENLLGILKAKLADLEIDIDEIIAITCDGASVMVKLGRISSKILQLCFAHGLHLGNIINFHILLIILSCS